jgi:hypothetical protein
VAKNSRGPTTSTSKHDRPVVRTSGEIFGDGSIIELVSPATDRQLQLLFWHKQQKKVAPQIEYRGRLYQVPDVNETLLQAIRFPSDADENGAAHKLFAGVRDLFERYIGVTPEEAALLTAWSTSTWFPECASSPPTLLISGTDMCHAITLLRMLRCLCRRALLLADISRSGLLDVTFLQPTLLLNQPGQLPKIWPLFGASNHHGVSVLGKGRAHNLAGCKAFFLGMEDTWTDGAIHFALPPARGELPTLDALRQAEIARRFQSRYLMYRLRNLQKIRESHSAVHPVNFPHTATAHNLAACIDGEPNIAQAIAPILQRQEQDTHVQNSCDVARVIIEVIWAPLHDREEIPISRISDLANALLRSRGETLAYSSEEVGWKLRNLGLYRRRNGSGKILRPSRENILVVHQLTRRFCLNLTPVHGCVDCVQPEVVVAE